MRGEKSVEKAMTQSMTGFGASEKGPFKVQIRSVNHRFLDIIIKMPQNLMEHEMPLRNKLRDRFSRGRFDVLITLAEEVTPAVKVNMDLAREIHGALMSLRNAFSLSGTVGIDTLAAFKEIMVWGQATYDVGQLYTAFEEALHGVLEMRNREGNAMVRDMVTRLDQVEQMRGEIASLSQEAFRGARERFLTRLNSLISDVSFDEGRVLQEAALMAERTDISEEVTRVASHIGQMRKILSTDDRIGRKAEFLLQELNREVNTIASKVDDYRITAVAVEMKAELEKIREQVQNIQ